MAVVAVFGVSTAFAQAQAPKKQPKDQVEYDLYVNSVKETDAKKKLALLEQWKQKYPNSDFKLERNQLFLATYQQLNQPARMIEVAKEMIADDPKEFTALYWITLLTPSLYSSSAPPPEALELGEKAASGMLSNLDATFAAEKKPANTPEDAWKKARVEAEGLGYKTQGWIAMQRKQNDQAEAAFIKSLQMNANNAEASYWLGLVMLAQKQADKQDDALFHFARAAAYDGQGALAPEARKTIDTYLTNAYTRYHGKDDQGLEELRQLARQNAFPPDGFKIKNIYEIQAENEEEFRRKNPAMAMWMNLKKELQSEAGQQYYETNLKNAHIPGGAQGVAKFRGTLISQNPAANPKELVLGVTNEDTPEVTLRLEQPLRGKAAPGTALEFEGVVSEFQREPFMLTLEVDEASKISGWPAPAPASKKAGKKAPPRKKK
jgi:tetratricopeptide (TPR) repeat protein